MIEIISQHKTKDIKRFANYHPEYLSVLVSLNQEPGAPTLCIQHAPEGQLKITPVDLASSPFVPLIRFLNENDSRPWMLVNGNTPILSMIQFTGQALRTLVSQPVAIYMYEPLFLLNKDGVWPWMPKEGDYFYAQELNDIQKFVENHDGRIQVHTYLCDYQLGDFFHQRGQYLDLNINTYDTYLIHHRLRTPKVPMEPPVRLEKHAINLNFRYEPIREAIMGYLNFTGHIEKTYATFYHKHVRELFFHRFPFFMDEFPFYSVILQGIEQMQGSLPFYLDAENPVALDPQVREIPDIDLKHNLRNQEKIKDWYRKSFFCIVNETRFSTPSPAISEKVMNAVTMRRPFVVVGAPHSLQYMREIGFKTFQNFWDESYDQMEKDDERLMALFRTFDFIFSQPLSALEDMNAAMMTTLKYNSVFFEEHFLEVMSAKLRHLALASYEGVSKPQSSGPDLQKV